MKARIKAVLQRIKAFVIGLKPKRKKSRVVSLPHSYEHHYRSDPFTDSLVNLASVLGARFGHAEMIAHEIACNHAVDQVRIVKIVNYLPNGRERVSKAMEDILEYIDQDIALEKVYLV